MVSLAGLKSPLMGLLLAVSYSSMVIDIIMITKVHADQNDYGAYPPAVVSMLVAAICQFLYCLAYFVRSGKGVLFKASSVAAALCFFLCFQVGSVAAATALRHHKKYCPPTASNGGDCSGVLRGTEGLGFAIVALNLIVIGFLAALVSKHGAWSDDLHNIPPIALPNADMEKAPVH
ncbi:hypothetical protein BCR39DRAFT_531887 [Naematelia encephala]|uniref:MARVEL domain-containing protein n=1 Tax=Naematelia encephala TaxID=71784 RepID=A0A1Y2B466_9TREE|nr:hypothetical protein BCR39DRAFT_531887 [Naematelia encephala]